jgi:hypothetical protein
MSNSTEPSYTADSHEAFLLKTIFSLTGSLLLIGSAVYFWCALGRKMKADSERIETITETHIRVIVLRDDQEIPPPYEACLRRNSRSELYR